MTGYARSAECTKTSSKRLKPEFKIGNRFRDAVVVTDYSLGVYRGGVNQPYYHFVGHLYYQPPAAGKLPITLTENHSPKKLLAPPPTAGPAVL